MTPTIRRKDFLMLTVTLTGLGASAACGDDDSSDAKPAGNSGDGSGGDSGGEASGGKASGGSGAGESGSGGDSGYDANDGGEPSSETGGAGGALSNEAGAGGDDAGPAHGGAAAAGAGGTGNAGDAAGAGGEASVQQCHGATLTQTAGTHDHVPANSSSLFASFQMLVDGSNPTVPFALPQNGTGHSHNITLTESEVLVLRAGGTLTGR